MDIRMFFKSVRFLVKFPGKIFQILLSDKNDNNDGSNGKSTVNKNGSL